MESASDLEIKQYHLYKVTKAPDKIFIHLQAFLKESIDKKKFHDTRGESFF